MAKKLSYKKTSITIPNSIYEKIEEKVVEQKIKRNVNISSFIVEILAHALSK